MKKILLIKLGFFLLLLTSLSYSNPAFDACTCDLGSWVETNNDTVSDTLEHTAVHKAYAINSTVDASTCTNNVEKFYSVVTDEYSYIEPQDDYYNYYNYTHSSSYISYKCVETVSPLDCPANSSPNADNTACICNPPYVHDNNETDLDKVCKLPSNVPDENSTKPDGDCMPGYAKNIEGVCKEDSDNDGVPDTEDAYPNDPNKSDDGSSDSGYISTNVLVSIGISDSNTLPFCKSSPVQKFTFLSLSP
jgi:hypothetical protein